jgi:hypothetical protein
MMISSRRRLCAKALILSGALAAAPGLLAVPAGAEIVESPPAAVTTAQVSVAMDNDWQFSDAECLFIPILVTYGRADDTSVLGETTVTKVGSTATSNEGTFLVLPGDPVSGQVLDEIFVCPADGTGEFQLATVVRAIAPGAEQSFSLDPLTFWVRPAGSEFTRLTARHTKGGVRIRGRVAAGDSVATGVAEIRVAKGATWGAPQIATVEDGQFDVVLDRSVAPRTRVKVTLTRCSWCSRASQVTRVR